MIGYEEGGKEDDAKMTTVARSFTPGEEGVKRRSRKGFGKG